LEVAIARNILSAEETKLNSVISAGLETESENNCTNEFGEGAF